MNIVNLTPHRIAICFDNGSTLPIEPSGQLARVSSKTVKIGMFNNIPITTTVYGDVVGLPEPKTDTIYIVSSLVAQHVKNRDDVFIPNESVRDDKGRIIGCRSLCRI